MCNSLVQIISWAHIVKTNRFFPLTRFSCPLSNDKNYHCLFLFLFLKGFSDREIVEGRNQLVYSTFIIEIFRLDKFSFQESAPFLKKRPSLFCASLPTSWGIFPSTKSTNRLFPSAFILDIFRL